VVGDAGATGVVEAPGRAEDDPVVVPVPVTADRVLSPHGAHIHTSPKTTRTARIPNIIGPVPRPRSGAVMVVRFRSSLRIAYFPF